MNRRKFLTSAGVFSILVTGGTVWRAFDQGVFSTGEGPAYEQWKNWHKTRSDGLIGLIQSAILAASPHNSQPWLFQIEGMEIRLYADTDRNIGAIDPYLREMYAGIGCALENLVLAAKANGYQYLLEHFPDPSDKKYTVKISLKKDYPYESVLYNAIPYRHTNRGPHDLGKIIKENSLNEFTMLGKNITDTKLIWLTTNNDKNRFLDLNARATRALIDDEEQSKSSFSWLRASWQEIQSKKDGVTMDTTGSSATLRAVAKIIPPVSRETGDQYFLEAMENLTTNTDRVGIIMVRDLNNNSHRLQGGRYWQRLHLWGTTQGMAMQPVSQICERIDREQQLKQPPQFMIELQKITQDTQWQALIPFRVGYPLMTAFASPRRETTSVII